MGKPTESSDRRFAAVPITLSFTNTGTTGLIVIASTYSLVGRKAQFLSSDKSPAQRNLDAQGGTAASTRLSVERYDVIQSDKFVFEGTEFQPEFRGGMVCGQLLVPAQDCHGPVHVQQCHPAYHEPTERTHAASR
jgi:hypothetical protein